MSNSTFCLEKFFVATSMARLSLLARVLTICTCFLKWQCVELSLGQRCSILFKCDKVTADVWLSLSWEEINQWGRRKLQCVTAALCGPLVLRHVAGWLCEHLIVIRTVGVKTPEEKLHLLIIFTCCLSCLLARMAQWGAVFSIIAALGGAALLASVHKIDEGHTGVYYRWAVLLVMWEISVTLLCCTTFQNQAPASDHFAFSILSVPRWAL